MKQFTFTSRLAPMIRNYLESRRNEGYTSEAYGYYLQELDCLSKELSDTPVVTKELIDAWDLLKPYLSARSKIARHNTIRTFAKFVHAQDGVSYVPDTSKLKNSSTFSPHIFTVDEIQRLLYAADNLPVRNNASTRHLVIPAVIRLLYCCGFRVSEVLRLRVEDVKNALHILDFPCGCSWFGNGVFFFQQRSFLIRNPGATQQQPVGIDTIGGAGDEGT